MHLQIVFWLCDLVDKNLNYRISLKCMCENVSFLGLSALFQSVNTT